MMKDLMVNAFAHSTKMLEGNWLLDSGASHHITIIDHFLSNCTPSKMKIATAVARNIP